MAVSAEGAAPAGYRYLRHLGAGGFGDVHLVEHLATGRRAAVKYIHRHLLTDPDVLARFRREAQILAATDVATVVRVYDLDTMSDPASLIMEFVPGVSLYELMERAPLPAHQALMVLRDVADALRRMAERGLVHRDIKPSNVLVLPSGRAKLGDFGLARAVAEDAGFRTVGAPAGTPAYFPPEVSSGDAEATIESDAYSFAVMAYEVLAGSRPITALDAISLITAHWTQPPRPVTDALPGFPVAAADVLMRALAKAPVGRPLPHELMAALDAVPADEWPTNHRPMVPVPDAPPLEPAYEEATGSLAPTAEERPGAEPLLPAGRRAAEPTVVAGSTPALPPLAPVTVVSPAPAPAPADRSSAPPSVTDAPRPRRDSRLVAGGVAVALVGSGLLAAWWLRDDDPQSRPETPDLEVSTVVVTARPATVRCPRAAVELVATIATNGGAGSVSVSWTLPDGSSGPTQAFALAAGQREVVARLAVTMRGTKPVHGDAVAEVTHSGLQASAPVTYRCPARARR